MRYVIKRADRPGLMLSGVGIGSCTGSIIPSNNNWAIKTSYALQFENQEEAQATIDFITNVIDWELGEQLYIEPANIN